MSKLSDEQKVRAVCAWKAGIELGANITAPTAAGGVISYRVMARASDIISLARYIEKGTEE